MIIVLLLFFQSICLFCQRLVLHIHDRWINPKNVRLLKEVAESSAATHKKLLQEYTAECSTDRNVKRNKKRYTTITSGSPKSFGILAEACRFCANTPQGYCRHHFHLQELHLQKQQKHQQQHRTRFWNPLGPSNGNNNNENPLDQRNKLRKINRELKRTLKNRYGNTALYQHTNYQQQQQQQHELEQNSQTYLLDVKRYSNDDSSATISDKEILSEDNSSGYYSIPSACTLSSSPITFRDQSLNQTETIIVASDVLSNSQYAADNNLINNSNSSIEIQQIHRDSPVACQADENLMETTYHFDAATSSSSNSTLSYEGHLMSHTTITTTRL